MSSGAVLAAPSSSGPSFSFHPKQQDMQPAVLQGPSTATAPAPSTATDTQPSNSHRRSKSNSDSSPAGKWGGLKSYYRYIMSPGQEEEEEDADVQLVQEAAGAALAEANERLLEAELRVQATQVRYCCWCFVSMGCCSSATILTD